MPVSHIGLTVSHLPSATSFFLSALQPLGYRYIGESGNQIGLGINDADFFLCQESPGLKAGAAHIAFTAPSRTAVRDFYTAALTAGGRSNGGPSSRCDEDGHFNAAVLDLDGNSIEVVYRNGPDIIEDGTVIEHSRVIKWQRTVHESYQSYRGDNRSIVSSRTSASKPAATEIASVAPSAASKTPSTTSKPGSIARSVSEPTIVTQNTKSGDGGAKTLIGTLLGAAAGAAVAYAMVRSEQDSAKKESEFNAFMDAKNTVRNAVGFLAQTPSQPQQSVPDPQPAPETLHRNIDVESYHSSSPPLARSVHEVRQIEAAPSSYHSPAPTHVSSSARQAPAFRAIEYAPATSVAPSRARSTHTVTRSVTSPEVLTVEKAKTLALTAKPESVVSYRSKAHSAAPSAVPSAAPSSLISSFVPDQPQRRVSEGSVLSHHSSRSKAKSSHSKHSRSSRHEEEIETSPSPPPPKSRAASLVPSKAASRVSSASGRGAKSAASKHDEDLIDDLDIEELTEDDMDTVVPSDSISQIGSTHRRKHRSKKHSDGSVVSETSTSSKHSKHSHRSHRSRKDDDDAASHHSTESKSRRSHRPSVVSEPSDASTVKPIKKSSRKDSVIHGQYENLFDEVQYGTGSVAVRGITPSMISASGKNPHRGMVNYNLAQKARAFEGQK